MATRGYRGGGRATDMKPPANVTSQYVKPKVDPPLRIDPDLVGNFEGNVKMRESDRKAAEALMGLDCLCKNNDPECAQCWDTPLQKADRAILKRYTAAPVSEFDRDLRYRFDECLELLLRKHSDYGPANIANAPGGPLNGLRVRLHDKMARINHLIDTGAVPENESLRDSFLDLANYSIIALMVLDSVWPTE